MDLSIVIVNWNTRDLLQDCLASIERNVIQPAIFQTETFAVDNASNDDSVAVTRQRFPWVTLIENQENVGFARANNQAIRQSQGRYVLLLNSDAQLVPGAVDNMISFLDATPKAGIASVRIASPDGSPQFCYGPFPNLYHEFRALFGLHRWDLSCWETLDKPKEVDWISGACLMARRTMLDKIGLLDETFFMFAEEVDLCYRAIQSGWRVFLVPAPPILHIRAGSTGKTAGRIMRLYRGRLHYANKHFGAFSIRSLQLMIIVSTLFKSMFYSLAASLNSKFVPQQNLWHEVLQGLKKDGIYESH